MAVHKKDYNVQYASTMIRTGAIVIDVRDRREFCAGHLYAAWHVNTRLVVDNNLSSHDKVRLYKKLSNRLKGYPENTTIIIYSADDIRVKASKDALETMGYRNVAVLGLTTVEPLRSILTGKTKVRGLSVCLCKSHKATLST